MSEEKEDGHATFHVSAQLNSTEKCNHLLSFIELNYEFRDIMDSSDTDQLFALMMMTGEYLRNNVIYYLWSSNRVRPVDFNVIYLPVANRHRNIAPELYHGSISVIDGQRMNGA